MRRRQSLLLTVAVAALLLAVVAAVWAASRPTDDPTDARAGTATSPATSTASPRHGSTAATPSTTASVALPLAGRVIALDPGHNRDNGQFPAEIARPVDAGGFQKPCNTTGTATDAGLPEATVNWELALAVRARLEGLGATVVVTRDANAGWGPCIDERAAIANRAGAELLLSLHADGAAADHHGFHVISPGWKPGWTDDIAAESQRAAVAVRDALVDAGLTPSNYLGTEGLDERTDLGTLNRADVPAVMLEAGNLRNPADAALLSDPGGRARVAEALAAAVTAFLTS